MILYLTELIKKKTVLITFDCELIILVNYPMAYL